MFAEYICQPGFYLILSLFSNARQAFSQRTGSGGVEWLPVPGQELGDASTSAR